MRQPLQILFLILVTVGHRFGVHLSIYLVLVL